MRSLKTPLRGMVLAILLALVLAPSASAQLRLPFRPFVNPAAFRVNPLLFMAGRQAAFNQMAVLGARQAAFNQLAALNARQAAFNQFSPLALRNNILASRQAAAAFQLAATRNNIPYLSSYFSPAQAAVNFSSYTQGWGPLARSLANASLVSNVTPYANPYAFAPIPVLGTATLVSNPYTLSAGLASTGYGGYGGYGSYGGSGLGMAYYNPYGYGSYYYDPYGGYFRGVGNLITSEGQYYNQYQDARMKSVQVERAKVDLRKALFDEWRYYREHTPTYEDLREASLKRNLNYVRRRPAVTDILSGSSLNTLLRHLKDAQAKGMRGPKIDLDPDSLKKINVRTDRGGNIGLLKNGGKLNWPLSLRLPLFDELRKNFELHVEQAVERASVDGKPIDAALLRDLKSELSAMNDTIDKNASKLSTGAFIDGKRYLNMLQDAVRALEDPNVADYFHGKYTAQGRTVDKLIDYMTKHGLKFAAATPGDETAYEALQTYLAAYDAGLTRLASR